MTLKKFFIGRAIGFGIVLILIFGIYAYRTHVSPTAVPEVQPPKEENAAASGFVWKYEKDDSLNLDGLPQTNVFLEVAYQNGAVQRKLIDTTPGGCNDLPDAEQDSVSGSTVAQCYSAGLGYRFKVVQGEESYLVKRKTFEEALPDDEAPMYVYEIVAEFPLYQ